MAQIWLGCRISSLIKTSSVKNHLLNTKQLKTALCASQNYYHIYGNKFNKSISIDKISKQQCFMPIIANKFTTSSPQLSDHKSHDHSKLWTFERGLAALLLPLVPAALLNPCQPLDTALAIIIVMHTHFGLEAIIVDYIRPILFGDLAPKIGIGLLYLFSILTLAGLLNLIYNDAGLANTIISIWKK